MSDKTAPKHLTILTADSGGEITATPVPHGRYKPNQLAVTYAHADALRSAIEPSLSVQVTLCERAATAVGLRVSEQFFDIATESIADDRRDLEHLVRYVSAYPVDCVIVPNLSVFGKHATKAVWRFLQNGTDVLVCN
jgi:hypothetical protein